MEAQPAANLPTVGEVKGQISNVRDLKVVPRNHLDDLAQQTAERWESLRVHLRRALEDALAVGALLNEAKQRLKHGQWGAWLKRCGSIPLSTAHLYRRLASADLPSEITSIRQARAFIQKSRDLSPSTSISVLDAAVIESSGTVCIGCDERYAVEDRRPWNRKYCPGCQIERIKATQARLLRWFHAERWGWSKRLPFRRYGDPIPVALLGRSCLVWPHSAWSPPLVLTHTDPDPEPSQPEVHEPPRPHRRTVTAVLVLGEVEMVNGIAPDVMPLFAEAAASRRVLFLHREESVDANYYREIVPRDPIANPIPIVETKSEPEYLGRGASGRARIARRSCA